MKKLVVLCIVALALVSCAKDEEFISIEKNAEEQAVTAKKLNSGENIKLHRAFTASGSKYGISSYQRKFEVELRNLAYNKDVKVLHQMADGSWQFFPMTYVKSTPQNTEIWIYSYIGNTNNFGDEFVFRYVVNGVEYWDNNNGQNYSMGEREGALLGSGTNILASNGYVYYNSFHVTADVQNLAYNKDVEVVYTTDAWQTVKTAKLSYSPSQTVGPSGESVPSPNAFGVELWTNYGITLNGPVQNLEYVLVYRVNGQEYWDNNFGQNYKAQIY